jgi:hypothetical protein
MNSVKRFLLARNWVNVIALALVVVSLSAANLAVHAENAWYESCMERFTASTQVQGLAIHVCGTPYSQLNWWDQGAATATYNLNVLNPPYGTSGTFQAIEESSLAPAIGMNPIHGQAVATNQFGVTGPMFGVAGESDLFAGPGAGATIGGGVWGNCYGYSGIYTTECDGGYFSSKVDAGSAVAQTNGAHITRPSNSGTVLTNCGLCVDDQDGIATGMNYAIKTGKGIVQFGDAISGVPFSSLSIYPFSLASNGSLIGCSDCASPSDPCTGGSTGALAVRQAGRWACK